jgi:hypothetical protein
MAIYPKPLAAASLNINGVAQLRVMRSMFLLSSFTRKEIAAHSGEGIEYVNSIVARHTNWFKPKERIRTGRPGPPEERLVLRADHEKRFLEVIDPFYKYLEAEESAAPRKASDYVPNSIEFAAASDLVALASKRGEGRPAEARRSLRLLEIASEKEGLPTAKTLEEYVDQTGAEWTSLQKAAKAHMDGLRARVCLLSVPELLSGRAKKDLGFEDPANLGLRFLENAVVNFTNIGSGRAALELDAWAEQHAAPLMVRVLSQQGLSDKPWYESLQTQLQSSGLQQLVPRFTEPFASKVFEIVDPARVVETEGKKRYVCTYVEMNVVGKWPAIRCATQKLVLRTTGRGIRVVMDDAKILQGLVSAYRKTYMPPPGKVAALLNVRHQGVQIAILKGDSLRLSRVISPSANWKKEALSLGILYHRAPIFSAGGRHVREEKMFLAAEVRKFIDFYKATEGGQKIDIVYLTGEPKVSEGVQEVLRSDLGLVVQPFDFGSGMKMEIVGFTQPQNVERARRLAPEIGFAWQQLETLNSKNLLAESTIEQWDELA